MCELWTNRSGKKPGNEAGVLKGRAGDDDVLHVGQPRLTKQHAPAPRCFLNIF